MKTLRKLVLPIISIAIIFSSLLYIGCEGDDDNVDDYFENNSYSGNADRESFADKPASTNETPVAVALSISPASSSAVPNQRIRFIASGGSGSYTEWRVGTTGHGKIIDESPDKTSATYVHQTAATYINTVEVTDSAGAVAIAKINH